MRRATGLVGLVLATLLLAFAIRGARQAEPWGRSAVTPAAWALATAFLTSRSLQAARRESIRILSVGAPGFLLLLSLVAPPVLGALESGRRLFLASEGREVLVLGAWRTAWMSGYFYNDGRVREIDSLDQTRGLIQDQARLILFGPAEWRQVQGLAEFTVLHLSDGPRGTVLARVAIAPPH